VACGRPEGSVRVHCGLAWNLLNQGVRHGGERQTFSALVDQARRYATVQHRSVPKQIEYWSQIGKIAEENPDLSFALIRDILIADQEEAVGEYELS